MIPEVVGGIKHFVALVTLVFEIFAAVFALLSLLMD